MPPSHAILIGYEIQWRISIASCYRSPQHPILPHFRHRRQPRLLSSKHDQVTESSRAAGGDCDGGRWQFVNVATYSRHANLKRVSPAARALAAAPTGRHFPEALKLSQRPSWLIDRISGLAVVSLEVAEITRYSGSHNAFRLNCLIRRCIYPASRCYIYPPRVTLTGGES